MIAKATLFRLHKFAGLAVAAFLLVQALTGLTLVYGADLAQVLDPAGMVSGPGRSDAVPAKSIAAAEAHYPGFRVARLVYPSRPDGTFLVHMADGDGTMRYLSLDRHDGSIRRVGSIWRFPVVAALNIHDQWLAGRPGMAAVMVVGFLLVFLAATGLAFWWPRRGRFGQSLTIAWHLSGRLVLRQLHRSTGVVISLLLIFMAVTGLFVIVPTVRDGLPKPWYASEPFAPRVEPALQLARREFPGRAVRDIRMLAPTEVHIFFHAPERNSRAVHRVVVDTRGPAVTFVRDAFDDNAAWVIALPLHSGEAVAWIGRPLILIGGLALAALAVTGPAMWLQARRARRSPRRASPPTGSAAGRA